MRLDRTQWARRSWARISGACIAVVAVALAAAATAAAQFPPTLTGEFFLADRLAGPGTLNVVGNCNPTGTSTISYSASGAASGPYPGTFTETGSAVIGPLTAPHFVGGFEFGFLTRLDAVFTIDSVTGQVTGSKSLVVPSTALGLCYDTSPGTFRELSPDATGFGLHYDATIETGGMAFGDTGDSALTLVDCDSGGNPLGCGTATAVFNEAFRSSGLTTFPLSTPGQATGGGRVGDSVAFGLTAKNDAQGMKGECTVIDRTANTTVKCLDVTSYVQIGNKATFSGPAIVNGSSTTYRIDVTDTAEPGIGADTFAIQAGGYSAGGTLTQGNIQVHG